MPSCYRVLVLLAFVAPLRVARAQVLEDCWSLWNEGRLAKALHCLQFSCTDVMRFCGTHSDCHASLNIPIPKGMTNNEQWTVELWQVCPASCGMCRIANASNATAVEAAIGRPCESGWEYISGVCLKHFVEDDLDWRYRPTVTWHDAQDRCRKVGAQLADVGAAPHRHMALELVRRRPRDLHGYAALAWVSWPAGDASASGGVPSNSSSSVVAPRAWLNSYDSNGFPPNIDSFRVEAGLDQLDSLGARRIGGWVCSKPARFLEMESGSCEEAGLRTVDSVQDCEAAARLLNLVDAPAISVSTAHPNHSFPAGCYYSATYGGLSGSAPWGTRLEFHKEGGSMPFNSSIQICLPATPASNTEYDQNVSSFAGEAANGNRTDEQRTREEATMTERGDRTSNVAIMLGLSCTVCYCSVVLVAVVNGKPLAHASRRARDFLQRNFKWFALQRSRRDTSALEALVASTMRRRRAILARFAAAVILTWHLFFLTWLALEPVAPCGGQDVAAEAEILKMMLGHLVQILATSVFLALQATEMFSGAWAVRVFAVATFARSFFQEATLGGHPILRQDRLWHEFLWRFLLGVSLDVPSMVGLIIVWSAGTMVLYSSAIPDNMIPVRLATSCTELFQDRATQSKTAFAPGLEASMTNLNALLNFVAGESTSVWAFATSEVVQCLILIFGLAAIGHVMAEEIRTNMQVRNSQSNSTAVSNILDRLCDAVVTIDSKFVITKSAPRLAGLLAISQSASLVGVDLRGRMPPEDAESLTSLLDGGLESADGAREPLALSMVDSLGIRVPCELFLAEFHDLGMARNYVIGINEVGERDREAAVGTTGSSRITSKGLMLPPLQENVREPSQEDSASEDSASSVGSQSECAFSAMASDLLSLDFKYLDGEIVAVSPAFNALVCSNNAVGTNVFDVMGSKERTCFRQWLKATAASLMNMQLPQVAVSKPIKLKLPQSVRSQTPVGNAHAQRSKHRSQWALLAVTFPDLPGQDVSDYVLHMKITKVIGQHTQASAGSETGYLLGRKAKPQPVPKGGSGEAPAKVIGRMVVSL